MSSNFVGTMIVITALSQGLAPGSLCAGSVVRVSGPTEFASALADAKPGTSILVAPGNYRGGLSRAGLHGTAEQPILIAAADPLQPPVIEGGTSGLHLSA